MGRRLAVSLVLLLAITLGITLAAAIPFSPGDNINMRNVWNITNLNFIQAFKLSGDINANNNTISNLSSPALDADAVNKAYVDSLIAVVNGSVNNGSIVGFIITTNTSMGAYVDTQDAGLRGNITTLLSNASTQAQLIALLNETLLNAEIDIAFNTLAISNLQTFQSSITTNVSTLRSNVSGLRGNITSLANNVSVLTTNASGQNSQFIGILANLNSNITSINTTFTNAISAIRANLNSNVTSINMTFTNADAAIRANLNSNITSINTTFTNDISAIRSNLNSNITSLNATKLQNGTSVTFTTIAITQNGTVAGNLTVASAAAKKLNLGTLTNGDVSLWTDATGWLRIGTAGQIAFFTAGGITSSSPALFVANNGDIGIGTTTPNHDLTVVGSINVTGGLNISGNIDIANSTIKIHGAKFENATHTCYDYPANTHCTYWNGTYVIET